MPKKLFELTKREGDKEMSEKESREGKDKKVSYCYRIVPVTLYEVNSRHREVLRREVNGPLHFMPIKFI